MSLTMDLSEEISPFLVTWRNNKLLDSYHQKTSSQELKFRSDLQSLQKPIPDRNNATEFTKCSRNFVSISPNFNTKEWLCLSVNDIQSKEDDGGVGVGVNATGENHRSGMDSMVRVSSNPKPPLSEIVSRLQDTIQEPNISPMEEKGVICMKRTRSCSADTEFGSDAAGNENGYDELGESLCWKKRKREIRDELKCHFEDLVNKMMKKQEDMYKVLLERQDDMYKVLLGKIEQKENGRITREGTWRNLEMERMRKEKKDRITREETWRKEEERRAQDTHLCLALGQKIVNTPESTRKQIISTPQSPKTTLHNQSGQKKQGLQKWPEHEVQALISLRMEMQHKLLSRAVKFGMWEEISLGMASMGFTRTAKKCKGKWEFINRTFKRAAGIGQKGAEDAAKSCPYFQEMDMFYKQCLVEAEIETS
ncbi:hypothetical protein MKX03_024012 [Papaver bracteatum]|nr:hypothetical protein MKX03_024012 [Papaver bracteatum]